MKKIISFFLCNMLYCSMTFSLIACTDDKEIGKIYDTISNLDGVEFTLVSYYANNKQTGLSLYDDTTIIGLSIIVTNHSNIARTFDYDSVDLYDSKGVKYKSQKVLVWDFDPHEFGAHVGGYVLIDVFENVDVNVSGLICVEFNLPLKSDEEKYTVKIGYDKNTKDNNKVVFSFSPADKQKYIE